MKSILAIVALCLSVHTMPSMVWAAEPSFELSYQGSAPEPPLELSQLGRVSRPSLDLSYHASYAQPVAVEPVAVEPAPVPVKNPHSKGLGFRIVGGVLIGTGILNLAIAKPYGDVMATSEMDGDLLRNLMLIEGGIRSVVGLVFLTSGNKKYGMWKAWEEQHSAALSVPIQVSWRFQF